MIRTFGYSAEMCYLCSGDNLQACSSGTNLLVYHLSGCVNEVLNIGEYAIITIIILTFAHVNIKQLIRRLWNRLK